MNDLFSNVTDDTKKWLEARRKPGNWFSISSEDNIPRDIVSGGVTLLHMFQLTFSPEIHRRIDAGELSSDFTFIAGQLLQPQTGPKVIRINEEVRGVSHVRVDRPVQKGEGIFASDLHSIEAFDLLDEELDCGHFTLLWNGKGWTMFFDFRSGRRKAESLLKKAAEFLNVARHSAEQGYYGPSTENLFSACELYSKSVSILHRNKAASTKTHGSIAAYINKWSKLGNVDPNFTKLFNRLSGSRAEARYEIADKTALPSQSEIDLVESLIKSLLASVAQLPASTD